MRKILDWILRVLTFKKIKFSRKTFIGYLLFTIVVGEIVVVGVVYMMVNWTTLVYNMDDVVFFMAPIAALISIIVLALPFMWWSTQILRHTIKRRQEAELAQRKLETLIEQRAKFLAYVSHEIRNPLNGIMGILGGIDMSNMTPHQKKKLGIVTKGSEDIVLILNDILDLSTVANGSVVLNNQPHDNHRLIEDLCEFWKARANDKKLDLQLEYDGEIPKFVELDAFRFRQIANNVISNAIKYTDKGTVHILAGYDSRNQLAEFTVTDSGSGVPTKLREAIFDPYVRVPEISAQAAKLGTGLGLPIARQLARLMGGDVILTPAQNAKGSQFKFILKAEVAEYTKPETSSRMVSDFSDKTALIVDDSGTNRIVARSMLSKLGFTTTDADCGATAIERLLSDEVFDLVLLDDNLGDMTSAEVMDKCKLTCLETVFVAYSGYHSAEDVQRFLDNGMCGAVPKPVDLSTLRQELIRVFSDDC